MLEDQIYVRLAERAWVGADFRARIDRGTVILSGTVPSEATKQGILRITRRTPGIVEVRDQMQVDPAVGASAGGSPVPDAKLSKHVAQQIASVFEGAKAGEDWWFTGWRVEGQDRAWDIVVHTQDGAVALEGEVPYLSMIRKAVGAAFRTQGVQSVRSELETETTDPSHYLHQPYHPYAYHRYGWGYPDYVVYSDATRDNQNRRRYPITGGVTAIDRQDGTLTLATDQGPVNLRFPPGSLKGVTEGERITVEVVVVK